MVGRVACGISLTLSSFGASIRAGSLVLNDVSRVEGSDGFRQWVIPVELDEADERPASVSFDIRMRTATTPEDYRAANGRLVFAAGQLKPGRPRPEESEDPLIRVLRLSSGFGLDLLAETENPVGLALAPSGSVFGDALYVGFLDQNGRGVSDWIVRVGGQGEVEDFARLVPEADPTSLEFAPKESRYGDFLFVSSNNRDGERPGDQGGTIQRVGRDGRVLDFSAIGIPFGPGEPGEMAFGLGSAFGDTLLVANSVGTPGDVLLVAPDGSVVPLVDDGLGAESGAGLAPRSLAVDTFGKYGGIAYFGEFGRQCSCIKKLLPTGQVEPWIDSLPGDPHSIVFAPPGPFEGLMYVAVDDGASGKVLQITPGGDQEVFLEGLQGFLHGNGKDVMEFSRDGSVLYVADYFADHVYRIVPATQIVIEVNGDRLPEPSEQIEIRFFDPVNVEVPRRKLVVTIEDDDESAEPPLIVASDPEAMVEDGDWLSWEARVTDEVTPFERLRVTATVGEENLVEVRDIAEGQGGDRLRFKLRPRPDQFGETELRLKVVDENGLETERVFPIIVNPVNDAPTLDPVADIRIPHDREAVEVRLSGMTTGAGNEGDVLAMSYVVEAGEPRISGRFGELTPEGTSVLTLSNLGPNTRQGDWRIAIILDDGQPENSRIIRRFLLRRDAALQPVDQPPSVAIVWPEDRQIFAPSGGGDPPTGVVPIRMVAEDDLGIARIELSANGKTIARMESPPFEFDWKDAPVGDHRLRAVAYDSGGQSAGSEDVDIAVGERRGQVALIRNHATGVVEELANALFEMGLEAQVFWPHELSSQVLAGYSLIVWDHDPAVLGELESAAVKELSRQHASGTPVYFMGPGLSRLGASLADERRQQWESLMGIEGESMGSERGWRTNVVGPQEMGREIISGSYGDVAGEELVVSLSTGGGVVRKGRALVAFDGEPTLVADPDPDSRGGEDGSTRLIHQVFRKGDGKSPGDEGRIKTLFQNGVCWLLRCTPCHAVDLALTAGGANRPGFLETLSLGRYQVLVRHSGECEATGVVLELDLRDGVVVSQFSSSQGRLEQGRDQLRVLLGRMGHSEEARVEWNIESFGGPGALLSARVIASNREVQVTNNTLTWVADAGFSVGGSIRIRDAGERGVEILVLGEEGARFKLWRSQNLENWVMQGEIQTNSWVPLRQHLDAGMAFYRAERVTP